MGATVNATSFTVGFTVFARFAGLFGFALSTIEDGLNRRNYTLLIFIKSARI